MKHALEMAPKADSPPAYTQAHQQPSPRHAAAGSPSGNELQLKLLMATLFLPEGLSFFIGGDFRLSAVRILLLILCISATLRFFRLVNTRSLVCVPSDVIALAAGIWMVLAAITTDGMAGLKGGGVLALEFTGAYYVFRYLLGPVDSSVQVIRFACQLVVLVVGVALLDPLTGKLFTYEVVKAITGYVTPDYEWAAATHSTSMYRNGLVRAMGPLEHAILFGTVCIWFGTLALCTFPSRLFGWGVAGIALIGAWFSQSRGPLVSYIIAFGLATFYCATKQFTARWKVLGSLVALGMVFVFFYSGNPVATLLRLGGIDQHTAWYRQAIWETAVPWMAQSPIFGMGLSAEWNWKDHGMLAGASVDALWLKTAMMFGIPGSVLILCTIVSAFWLGPTDKSRFLSREEKRLSVALGFVVTTAVFLGFTVHFWGTCWILLGVFAGMRANLAEAAILRCCGTSSSRLVTTRRPVPSHANSFTRSVRLTRNR